MAALPTARSEDEWDVYALAAPPLPRRIRVAGRALRVFMMGSIAVIAARPRESRPVEEALREQHAVVVALADRIDPLLPARFGSRMNAARLEAAVRQAAGSLSRALEHVRGRRQMTVRVIGPSSAPAAQPAAPTTGTAYLAQRLAQAQSVPAEAAPLRDAVAPFVIEERVMPGRGSVRATLFHLVAREDVDRYRSAAERIRAPTAASLVRTVVTGPWPPFAFAPELWR
jgi:hypothetical protein